MAKNKAPERLDDRRNDQNGSFQRPNYRMLLVPTLLMVLTIGSFLKDRIMSVLGYDSGDNPVEVVKKAPDFKNYVPPKEFGRVVYSNLKPDKKTIVYIVDEHPDSSVMSKDMVDYARRIQRALYFLLRDMIKKFGRVPVVFENLIRDFNAADLNLDYLRLRELAGVSTDKVLAALIKEPDLSNRVRFAEENVGKCDLPAGMFAMVAHPEILPIGPDEIHDAERGVFLTGGLEPINAVFSHPEAVLCYEGTKDSMTLEAARKRLARGSKSAEVVDCVCSVRMQANDFLRQFERDRFIDSPRREIDAAERYEGDVVVIAGTNHLSGSIKLMDARGLSYIVIAPNGTENDFPAALTVPPRPIPYVPNDKSGICTKWEEKAEMDKAQQLRRWLMEE